MDKKVLQLYSAAFEGISEKEDVFALEAVETNKSYHALVPVFQWLLSRNFRKDANLVVVGGGITQDVGAFASNLLLRGIRWSFIPTTLLAQGDSCIGSKSSINFGNYKNQLGYFYPPHSVHICSEVLSSLSDDDWSSGLGEIIKLAIISGEESFKRTVAALPLAILRKPIISDLVREALAIKKCFIEEDELDQGSRRLLNFGHTFGHAFESATNYRIPHGVAVSIGMSAAAFVSRQLELIDDLAFEKMIAPLKPLFEKFIPELLTVERNDIFSAMRNDKKNTKNHINCILLRGLGKLEITPLSLSDQVVPMVSQFLNWLGDPLHPLPGRFLR
ncbi:MAG: 3-dehydroquinate synthase [Pseudomonadota bacterium]